MATSPCRQQQTDADRIPESADRASSTRRRLPLRPRGDASAGGERAPAEKVRARLERERAAAIAQLQEMGVSSPDEEVCPAAVLRCEEGDAAQAKCAAATSSRSGWPRGRRP